MEAIDYWKKRCEAAEKVIFELPHITDDSWLKWRELRQSPLHADTTIQDLHAEITRLKAIIQKSTGIDSPIETNE